LIKERLMEIKYKFNLTPTKPSIIDLYISSGLNRPTKDQKRISQMYSNSNLVIGAWHKERLVGISRSLTDFCHCCYLSDLTVREEYKRSGIGKKLIELTKEKVGLSCMLVLLSAPAAMQYYPKIGLEKV